VLGLTMLDSHQNCLALLETLFILDFLHFAMSFLFRTQAYFSLLTIFTRILCRSFLFISLSLIGICILFDSLDNTTLYLFLCHSICVLVHSYALTRLYAIVHSYRFTVVVALCLLEPSQRVIARCLSLGYDRGHGSRWKEINHTEGESLVRERESPLLAARKDGCAEARK